jgi:transposase-like protein
MQRAHDEVMAEDGPTLPEKPRRRTFTAEYKLSVVEEYDACAGDGDKGALLRREGLYSSHIVEWRRARDAGGKSGLGQAQRKKTSRDAKALAKANAKIERLESDLAKHKLALGIAGKAHALLEMLAESAQDEPRPKQ